MSCFATIKSPINGKAVTSPAYYQLTSFFPADQGKKIYEAITTNTFKTELGFDWTKPQQGYSPKLNFVGEPNIHVINKHLRLGLTVHEIRAAEQIEEVASLGYLNKGYRNPHAFDFIVNEINLNPKYDLIEAEVLVRDGKNYLSVKPTPNGKTFKPVSKDYLRTVKFPEFLINSVEDFSNAKLIDLMDGLIANKQIPAFQLKMLEKLRNLMKINPTLRLTVFDDAAVEDEYQRSFYDPKSNTIYIGKTVSSEFNTAQFAQELVHEAVHAYTISAITNPTTVQEIRFRQEMEQFMGEYKAKFPRLQVHYGFKNVEEFVSEYLSNPYFREDLQEAERTAKDKTFVGRVVNKIKNFLKNLLGQRETTLFDKVNESIEDYFDYLEQLEDMPELPGEHQLRFNQPYNSAQPTPHSIDITKFQQYVEATLNSASWKQLSQSLSEIDPRFASIERIREKFGNISSSSLANVINSSIDYLQSIDQLIDRVQKDVDLHVNNLSQYSAEDLVKVLNHAISIADFVQEQIASYNQYLVPELRMDATESFMKKNPTAKGTFLDERRRQVENFDKVSQELQDKLKRIDDAANAMGRAAKAAMLSPVAEQLAEPFSLIAEKLKAPDSQLNQELEAKRNLRDQAIANNEVKKARDLDKDIKQLEMFLSWVPSVENIKKLLQTGMNPDYKGANLFTIYLGVAEMSASPLVQVVKQYINVHLTEAENVSRDFTQRATDIEAKVEARNKRRGIKWTSNISNFYTNLTREVEMVYYDADGRKKVVKQLAYNTRFKEAEFHNDLQELKRAVDAAKKGGVEAEIIAAEEALQKFLDDYAVRPYTDEFYEAEELLTTEAKEARQEILDQLEEHQAVFGDAEATEEERQHRADLRRQYERLGSIYYLDGTEKPKGSKDRDIADSIIAYKNKRKALEAVEFVIPEKVMQRFRIEKESRQLEVNNLSTQQGILTAELADAESKGEDTTELQAKLAETTQKLEKAKEELKTWLANNTRTEIAPEFFELQRSIADQIKAILIKYGDDPQLSAKYDALFNAVKGYRDQDGVIIGSDIKRGLASQIKSLEEEIEKLKEIAEQDRNMSDADKAAVKALFKRLFSIQEKKPTEYYRLVRKEIEDAIRGDIAADPALVREIQQLAETNADAFIEMGGFDADNLPTVTNLADFGTPKHRKELVDAFFKTFMDLKVSEKIKETAWYQDNHITITKKRVDVKTGEEVIQVYERPIYIWNKTIPVKASHIKQESPSFEWSVPRVRAEYKNKDYNYLGTARPRETADRKYSNEAYDNLPAEDKELVDEMVGLYEDIQRKLPASQRLKGYTVPNRTKFEGEKVVDLFTRPKHRFNSIVDGFKLIFKEGLPGEDMYEDEVSSLIGDKDNAKHRASGRKVQLIKTRYKEPLNINQVSHLLTNSLAEFGAYAAEFEGLRKAMPTVFAAREAAEDVKVADGDLKMIDNEISRFFYGGEVSNKLFGDNPYAKMAVRAMRRLFRFSQARVLLFNFLRLFKNVFNNFMKIMLSKNRYGLSRRELLAAWWKGMRMRSSLLSLEVGSKKYSEYALKLIHFRAVPAANPSKMTGNVHQGFMYKYMNAENFSAQVFGYTEMASTIPIYEALMDRMSVPMIVNGQEIRIKLNDAYDVIDNTLVPKDGVFGLEQNKMRSLLEERKQIIDTYLINAGVANFEQLTTKQKMELNSKLNAQDVKIKALEASNKLKRDKLQAVEQYLRDQIHEMYTSTQGNYFSRSRSYYERSLLASFVMSMRRWLAPLTQTNFGQKRLSLYTGNLEEGFYRTGGKALIRKMRYLASGERMDLGSTEFEQEKYQRIWRDNLNVIGLHALSLGLVALALGGGGDDESPLLSLLAIIGLGTYDEYVSLHPVIAPMNWTYKTFFRKPLAKPGEEQGTITSGVKHGLYTLMGQQMRSYDQIYDALFDWRNITDPMEPYYEQRKDYRGISFLNTPKPTKGLPRVVAMGMKVYGIEMGLKPFYEPKKRVMDMLKLNPMVGMQDPLGDYIQVEKKIQDLQEEMLRRDIGDLINFAEGNWDQMSKPNGPKIKKQVAQWGALQLEKQLMEQENKVLAKYELERKFSSYEGQQDRKALETMLTDFYNIELPKAPKNQQYEIFKEIEKVYQAQRINLIKGSMEMEETQNQTPD